MTNIPIPKLLPTPPEPNHRLPDFILGGAMKSGTTTLHHLLSHHDKIYIPDPEIHFFCIDDIEELPESFGRFDGSWAFHDYEANLERYLAWYAQFFSSARPDQCVGEDSTVYLASAKAPARIRALMPEVKLIFLLRDPVRRTYSQYWHYVQTGRAMTTFESAIRFNPGTYLTRSFYHEQLSRYYDHFPRDQIKVILFEHFVRDQAQCIQDIFAFLGLEIPVQLDGADVRRNKSKRPFVSRLQLFQNRIFRPLADTPYLSHLPDMPDIGPSALRSGADLLNRGLRFLNRRPGRYPPMRPETKAFLERFFAKENAGLSELIGQEVSSVWEYMP